MSGFEITCVSKNPDGRLVRIGGNGWSLSVREAIVKLSSSQLRFHIRMDNRLLDIGMRGDGQETYLVLEPDGLPLHDLTTLPGC